MYEQLLNGGKTIKRPLFPLLRPFARFCFIGNPAHALRTNRFDVKLCKTDS